MKITICASLSFSKEIIETAEVLGKAGHKVFIPSSAYEWVKNPGRELNMDLEYCLKNNVQQNHFNKIADSDAILVLNHERKGIKRYVGGSALMEMAVAKHLNKKIFLLYPPPSVEDLRYSMEIQLTEPIILNGNLDLISQTS